MIGTASSTPSHSVVWFVDATTVWTLFVRVADGVDVKTSPLQVVIVTLHAEELSVTQGTEGGWFGKLSSWEGLLGFDEIGAVVSFARRTPFTATGVIGHIVVIESSIALVTEVGFVDEPFEGITSAVVFTLFDETNDLVGRNGSSVDDHVRRVDGHDLDLVSWQGGLKLCKFQ